MQDIDTEGIDMRKGREWLKAVREWFARKDLSLCPTQHFHSKSRNEQARILKELANAARECDYGKVARIELLKDIVRSSGSGICARAGRSIASLRDLEAWLRGQTPREDRGSGGQNEWIPTGVEARVAVPVLLVDNRSREGMPATLVCEKLEGVRGESGTLFPSRKMFFTNFDEKWFDALTLAAKRYLALWMTNDVRWEVILTKTTRGPSGIGVRQPGVDDETDE